MKTILKYTLLTAAALLVLFLVRYGFSDKEKEPEQIKDQVEVGEETNSKTKPETFEIPISDLKIKPITSIENEVYMLTAYDLSDEKTFVFIGNFEGQNQVRFFDLETNQIKAELNLPEILLDVFSEGDQIYVLGEKSIFKIKDNQILQNFRHQIPAVFTFDRMLSLDDQIYVSMSDGSAWVIGEEKVEKKDKLNLNGNSIWIQKTSPKAFRVELSEEGSINYTSENSLGAMTVLGQMNDKLVCVIEKVTSQQPLVVQRAISSSEDNFSTELQVVDMQPYAFLKNDLRLHGDVIYHLTLHSDKISLVSQKASK